MKYVMLPYLPKPYPTQMLPFDEVNLPGFYELWTVQRVTGNLLLHYSQSLRRYFNKYMCIIQSPPGVECAALDDTPGEQELERRAGRHPRGTGTVGRTGCLH